MLLPWPRHAHITPMDADIVYYVAGFVPKSVKASVTCAACGDILGENSALEINIEGMIPENCQFLVDEINRGGLVKPSVLVCMQYAHLPGIRNYETKSLFYHPKCA